MSAYSSPSRRSFRRSEVSRAIRAVKEAGESIRDLVIEPDGKVIIKLGQPPHANSPEVSGNPWDEVLSQ